MLYVINTKDGNKVNIRDTDYISALNKAHKELNIPDSDIISVTRYISIFDKESKDLDYINAFGTASPQVCGNSVLQEKYYEYGQDYILNLYPFTGINAHTLDTDNQFIFSNVLDTLRNSSSGIFLKYFGTEDLFVLEKAKEEADGIYLELFNIHNKKPEKVWIPSESFASSNFSGNIVNTPNLNCELFSLLPNEEEPLIYKTTTVPHYSFEGKFVSEDIKIFSKYDDLGLLDREGNIFFARSIFSNYSSRKIELVLTNLKTGVTKIEFCSFGEHYSSNILGNYRIISCDFN